MGAGPEFPSLTPALPNRGCATIKTQGEGEGMTKTEIYVYWGESEWAEEGWSTVVNGICGDVWKNEEDGTWRWSVEAGSRRCEWPEIVAVGKCKSAQAAKNQAARKIAKADAVYPVINWA